jgi:hypothetical protein
LEIQRCQRIYLMAYGHLQQEQPLPGP